MLAGCYAVLEMAEEGEGEICEGDMGLYSAGGPVVDRTDGEVVLVHPEGFLYAPQAAVMVQQCACLDGILYGEVGDYPVKAVPLAVLLDLFRVQDVAVLFFILFQSEEFVRPTVGDEGFSRQGFFAVELFPQADEKPFPVCPVLAGTLFAPGDEESSFLPFSKGQGKPPGGAVSGFIVAARPLCPGSTLFQ